MNVLLNGFFIVCKNKSDFIFIFFSEQNRIEDIKQYFTAVKERWANEFLDAGLGINCEWEIEYILSDAGNNQHQFLCFWLTPLQQTENVAGYAVQLEFAPELEPTNSLSLSPKHSPSAGPQNCNVAGFLKKKIKADNLRTPLQWSIDELKLLGMITDKFSEEEVFGALERCTEYLEDQYERLKRHDRKDPDPDGGAGVSGLTSSLPNLVTE